MNREAISVALYNRIVVGMPAGLIKTKSRILKHWSDVPTELQPALFLAQGNESIDTNAQKMGAPSANRRSFLVHIYTNNKANPEIPPATALNAILDALETALLPHTGLEKQTLGGLVKHLFISGPIETDEGTLGQQAVAIVPIEVLVV